MLIELGGSEEVDGQENLNTLLSGRLHDTGYNLGTIIIIQRATNVQSNQQLLEGESNTNFQ